jgi:hypothetical protein
MLIINNFTGRCNLLRSALLTAKPLEYGCEAAAFFFSLLKAAASLPPRRPSARTDYYIFYLLIVGVPGVR